MPLGGGVQLRLHGTERAELKVAGWGWGTDRWESGEFFRAKITNAMLLDW